MITLAELKQELNITDTDKDAALQGFISSAISVLDSLCNRNFIKKDFTEYKSDCGAIDKLYLKNIPINSVESIQYWNGTEYTDLLSDSDTISDTITNTFDYILLRKGYTFFGKDLKIVYNAGYKFISGTGTLRILVGNANVEGLNGTLFQTEITAGDYLCFEGERIRVSSITSNSVLILESPVSRDYISVGYNISDMPEDLRSACKQYASKLYYESGIGGSLLLKSNESKSGTNAGSSVGYKELDLTKLIDNYRIINI